MSVSLITAGCTTDTNEELAAQGNCSPEYIEAFQEAVATGDVDFCLGDTPDPAFIEDGVGDYCFVAHSSDPADFSTLHATSVVTDCVNQFAQQAKDVKHCSVLQGEEYESSGLGATAYNTCVLNYATTTGDIAACDTIDETAIDPFDGVSDKEECLSAAE